MNSLSSNNARKQLPASLHGLLDLVVANHIKHGHLQGLMVMPDKTNIDGFVIVDSDEARELLQSEINAVGSVLTRPNAPFPFPIDYLTPELLTEILEARERQEKQRRERQGREKTVNQKDKKAKASPSPNETPATPNPLTEQQNQGSQNLEQKHEQPSA